MNRRITVSAPGWAWMIAIALVAILAVGMIFTAAKVDTVEAMTKEMIQTRAQEAIIAAANAEEDIVIDEPIETAEMRQTSIGTIKITHYCACERCCPGSADGVTASGTVCAEGRTIACDFLPFGTIVNIGGNLYTVEDRIGDGSTNHIDIYVADHERALQAGVASLECYVVTFGEVEV